MKVSAILLYICKYIIIFFFLRFLLMSHSKSKYPSCVKRYYLIGFKGRALFCYWFLIHYTIYTIGQWNSVAKTLSWAQLSLIFTYKNVDLTTHNHLQNMQYANDVETGTSNSNCRELNQNESLFYSKLKLPRTRWSSAC